MKIHYKNYFIPIIVHCSKVIQFALILFIWTYNILYIPDHIIIKLKYDAVRLLKIREKIPPLSHPIHITIKFSKPLPFSHSTSIMAANPLELRPLGNTGLKLSCVGFGASPLGNVFGVVSESDAIATVRRAFSLGINFFDTSP